MALNNNDISKVSYKADIEWSKKRVYEISSGEVTLEDYLKEKNPDFEVQDHTPEELISILGDLSKKSSKLEDKIASLSRASSIPVDKVKQPETAKAVAQFDPSSGGDKISYELYDKLLREHEYAYSKISAGFLAQNLTGDASADSAVINDNIYQNYADYAGQPKDNSIERYANRWLNNLLSWNEHDYGVRQILNFSDNYLGMSPDPAFLPWKMRADVGETRIDVENLGTLWEYFSADYADKVEAMVDGFEGMANLRPNETIKDLTTRSIVYANDFLNQLNQAFDIHWASDLICCFMQWGIRLDVKTLKALRALLQLLNSGLVFDSKDVLDGFKDILNNIFRGLINNQLMGLVTYIMQALVDPIKRWINNPPDANVRKLFACTPIDELINTYITSSMDYLESMIRELLNNWYKKIEIQHIKNDTKVELLAKQKTMGELAKLLDAIIASAERTANCGIPNSPNSESVQKMISDYSLQDQTVYVFPAEENPTIYNSFIPKTPDETVAEAANATAAQTKTAQLDSGARTGSSDGAFRTECLKKVPEADIAGVKEWMDIIDTKSQGRV